jgi:hypothetical protein
MHGSRQKMLGPSCFSHVDAFRSKRFIAVLTRSTLSLTSAVDPNLT